MHRGCLDLYIAGGGGIIADIRDGFLELTLIVCPRTHDNEKSYYVLLHTRHRNIKKQACGKLLQNVQKFDVSVGTIKYSSRNEV